MLFKKFSILLITIISLFFQIAWAKDGFSLIKGQHLKQWCTVALQVVEQKDVPKDLVRAASDASSCINYIVAVNDALFLQAGIAAGVIKNRDAKIQMPYCLPDNLENEDYIKAILQFINENPSALGVQASVVVYGALIKQYPCD